MNIRIAPHKLGEGGTLAMPLRANVPEPARADWTLVSCPVCGTECWESDLARSARAAEPGLKATCTTCALKSAFLAEAIAQAKEVKYPFPGDRLDAAGSRKTARAMSALIAGTRESGDRK